MWPIGSSRFSPKSYSKASIGTLMKEKEKEEEKEKKKDNQYKLNEAMSIVIGLIPDIWAKSGLLCMHLITCHMS